MIDEPEGDGLTPEQPATTPKRRGRGKAKGKRGRPSKAKREAKAAPESYARVVSVAGMDASPTITANTDLANALAEIERLKGRLGDEVQKRTEAEAAALAAAEAQSGMMQSQIQEVATGKTVRVTRCTGYEVKGYKDDGREILKPKWGPVDLPTYFYKVELAPNGGMDFKINGTPLYHGATYEFDIDTLRTVKEICARGWDHERNIMGSNENAYRPQKNPIISARAFR